MKQLTFVVVCYFLFLFVCPGQCSARIRSTFLLRRPLATSSLLSSNRSPSSAGPPPCHPPPIRNGQPSPFQTRRQASRQHPQQGQGHLLVRRMPPSPRKQSLSTGTGHSLPPVRTAEEPPQNATTCPAGSSARASTLSASTIMIDLLLLYITTSANIFLII